MGFIKMFFLQSFMFTLLFLTAQLLAFLAQYCNLSIHYQNLRTHGTCDAVLMSWGTSANQWIHTKRNAEIQVIYLEPDVSHPNANAKKRTALHEVNITWLVLCVEV